MSGCYGNSPEDKYFESMLFRYLDEQEDEDELTPRRYRRGERDEEYESEQSHSATTQWL